MALTPARAIATHLFPSLLSLCVSCGGSPRSAAHPEVASTEPTAVSSSSSARSLPDRCARGKRECVPPPGWVKRLCDDVYPDVALNMFKPGTRWQRLYMLARAEPFNASGGASLLGDKMERGEEVIALERRDNNGEFQVGDNAGYDVLRWNGACATIHDGDFAREPPHQIAYSKIEWRRLGLDIRKVLEAQPEISAAETARRKACHGFSIGEVTKDCEVYDRRFMDEIIHYVQAGGKIPSPSRLP
jgi:hypothetical protein